jgi:hypothetical protein
MSEQPQSPEEKDAEFFRKANRFYSDKLMSEQPQELSSVHIEHYFPKGYNPDDEPWKSIKAHHNAALAANDDKWRERFIKQKFGPATQRSEQEVKKGK